MVDYLPRIVLVAVLIFLSGFFSGSETALFSLDQIQRRRIGLGSSPTDKALRWLLSQPRRLIATLLVGNELVNISISTLVASLTHDVAATRSPLQETVYSMAVAVPLVLLLGEVTPKTIAIRIPEIWARAVARPLRLFATLITPLRWTIRSVADFLIGLLGGQPPPRERPLSEEEFLSLVEQGSRRGEVDEEERDIIENVFEFGDTTVADIMTPKERIYAIPVTLTTAEAIDALKKGGYSRVPVYEGDLDTIVGILYAKDLVGYGVDPDVSHELRHFLRTPVFVPKATKCANLFRSFREQRTHMGIVVDEYGRTAGLVTMQDLLDEIFEGVAEEEESARSPEAVRNHPHDGEGGAEGGSEATREQSRDGEGDETP